MQPEQTPLSHAYPNKSLVINFAKIPNKSTKFSPQAKQYAKGSAGKLRQT